MTAEYSRLGDISQQVVPHIPDLNDPANRTRFSRLAFPAVTRMLDLWGLNLDQKAELTGLKLRTYQRYLTETPSDLNRDQLTRLSLITGIFKDLRILHSVEVADGWVTRPSQRLPFKNRSPVAFMIENGIPGLIATRRILDADRGGRTGPTSPEIQRKAMELLNQNRTTQEELL